jgi:hypothetical protein
MRILQLSSFGADGTGHDRTSWAGPLFRCVLGRGRNRDAKELIRTYTSQFSTIPMPIAITRHTEGAVIAIRAQPGAKRNAVLGEQAGALKVAVAAPPEDGRANAALVEVLREWLGVKRSQVELVGGKTNRNKTFLIRGIMPEELQTMVAARLAET